ncbi:peroxidase family protein [uncultured Paraglaciecola sp.]|uniref:peroxidase family protein n=1 Tax=uncultured Paraglaciecola sp. TaxID=1765024 RepID=UPI002592696C|nr:peroxidase family protein [uncultured Paraglaciecola sp.]
MNQHRLFPIYAKEPLLTECQIKKVAEYLTGVKPREAQKNNTKSVAKNNKLFANSQSKLGKLDAGYTYFGQFISHEIVPCSNPEPSEHNYTTTPELDLKSLYGEPSQYSIFFDEEGKFKTNQMDSFDVIRDKNHVAIIPDQRNDENAIILQFHVLWQKIHNEIINRLTTPVLNEKCGINNKAIHKQARQITTSLFHYLTIYDFAARLLHPDVFRCYFNDDKRVTEHNMHCQKIRTKSYLYKENSDFDAIPVEFSHAVFRFGHSMVRPSYALDINAEPPKKNIDELFRSHPRSPLSCKLQILNWNIFFGDEHAQPADPLQLKVSSCMGKIPIEKHIVELNLKAGERVKLPSGFWIKEWISKSHPDLALQIRLNDEDPLQTSNFDNLSQFNRLLSDHYKCQTLPLWLYTLEEAQLEQPYRKKLGRVSSTVIAEVLRQSILKYQLTSNEPRSYSSLKQSMINESQPLFTEWLAKGDLTMQTLLQHLNLIRRLK